SGLRRLPAKEVVDRVSYGREAVYAAQFCVDALVTEAVAHRGTRLDRVESNACRSEFVSHACECMGTLHIHQRCGGKIQHYQLRRHLLAADTAQDRIANIVDVKIDQNRFRPENHYVWNQFVV